MGSLIDKLMKKELINPPSHMKNNVQYEVLMGSVAYGCSNDTSDMDIYGFTIPYKDMIFPHLAGHIQGFGRQIKKFDQFQMHHIKDKEEKKEYDLSIYNIVKYFQLCMDNNPNMIDSLFVPRRCILHSTQLGEHVRENRRMFLHKGSFFKLKGYSFSQLHKMESKSVISFINQCKELNIDPLTFNIEEIKDKFSLDYDSEVRYAIKLYNEITKNGQITKRLPSIMKYGFDLKFGYHIVRLLNQCEQILIEHDLDLERNREQLKAIRRGDWTKDQIIEYFNMKEKSLEELYTKSTLQHSPNEDKIKTLLLECLEIHFGSLDNAIHVNSKVLDYTNEILRIAEKLRKEVINT